MTHNAFDRREFLSRARVFATGIASLALVAAAPQQLRAEDSGLHGVENTESDMPHSVIERWQAAPETIFDAEEVTLSELAYIARPLFVFADSPNQPQFLEQLRLLEAEAAALAHRDVILIADSNPSARSEGRRHLRPRGFSLVLMDKDGTVVFRKAAPWDAREISRQIDKLPSRLQELRSPD